MRIPPGFILIAWVVAAIMAAGCTGVSPLQDEPATVGEMVDFVEEAIAYAEDHGKEEALREFSDPHGSFVRGELYIYAYDFNGTTIAHPFNPEMIGVNRLNETDAKGHYFIRELRDAALDRCGYVAYYYINPADERRVESKLGFVAMVDEDWWLGSGIYNPGGSDAGFASREELTEFVNQSAEYARKAGQEAALAAFNDVTGIFVEGDRYIFAYDYEGNALALPYQPCLVGNNRMDHEDANGVRYIREMIDNVLAGGGYVSYLKLNPTTGWIEPKLSYVVPVNAEWWIGAGFYNCTNAPAGQSAASRDELVSFVREATAYSRDRGREEAVAVFNDPAGNFTRGSLYIWAYDMNGTNLAHPYHHDYNGENKLNLTDSNGVRMIFNMASIAGRNGTGFTAYAFENPETSLVEPKLAYVERVDQDWWVASGIYQPPV
jgi:signal transduction histidine kinase